MDCQLPGTCLEVVVALARHSVHESEWRPSRNAQADAYPFAIFYVLCTVRSRIKVQYIKERSVIIIQWRDYLRVWRLRFVIARAMGHTCCARPGIVNHHDDHRRPWAWAGSVWFLRDRKRRMRMSREYAQLPNYRLRNCKKKDAKHCYLAKFDG